MVRARGLLPGSALVVLVGATAVLATMPVELEVM
jgi:hypothetical protein